jgi:magnesium transporter
MAPEEPLVPAAPGAPPGTLVGPAPTAPPTMVARRFSADGVDETTLGSTDELAYDREATGCLWLDVVGAPDAETAQAIGAAFDLHPLALEDLFDPRQRPKVDSYDRSLFIVLHSLVFGDGVEERRVALFVGDGFVVSFQEVGDPSLEPVRLRLRQGRGRIRQRGADYLAYAIIDSIVDHYFPALDRFDDALERIEDEVLDPRTADPVGLAREARQELQTLRHAIWPARDVMAALQRHDLELIGDDTRIYLRDCNDHIAQLVEMVEASREIAASLLEAYISRVGLDTNRAMKVLTVIATIFIPLTFITGVYGMNFDPRSSPLNMPELRWAWGYPFVLGLMVAMALAMVAFFRRRGWF